MTGALTGAEEEVWNLVLLETNKGNTESVTKRQQDIAGISMIDAYKGAGAFFTMQNLIRFHGCRFVDEYGVHHDKERSYAWLQKKNEEYRFDGWRMIGLLRKFLKDNHIDICKKMAEWRKRK